MESPKAKKSLGQHWLSDLPSLEAMCDAAKVGSGDEVFEIGPGTGELTARLMARHANIFALEYDQAAVDYLSDKFARQLDVCLHVEMGDIRTFNLNNLSKNYKVVANIPYYLTANLLRILADTINKPTIAALLVQKEVAERVAAKPGDMSLLSVIVQYYYDARVGQVVPAKLFDPQPKVDSQILILQNRTTPLFDEVDSKQFFQLVKAGFSSRRKTLLNSLSAGLHLSKDATLQILQEANINPNARPQELSLQQWHDLYASV